MTAPGWEALPCGADPELLVEYATEGAEPPAGSHEAECGVLPGCAPGARRALAPGAPVVGTGR